MAPNIVVLLDWAETERHPVELTPEQEAEVRAALVRADRGEYASEAEMARLFRKSGL